MIKSYNVRLSSEPSLSFMATKAANSMDIDIEKKLTHELSVQADVETHFNVGLIVGNSGSGKTTLAHQILGIDCFDDQIDNEKPIIDQFPSQMSYEDRASILNSIGLSQVVCWIRPVKTLSNGQKFRALAALKIAKAGDEVIAIDEWTSVVDRTVAKVMSYALAKSARRFDKKFVLVSCHSDVIEWLAPDWIIDCNKQSYEDRRSLQQERKELLQFEIRPVSSKTWRYFSRYHYLSQNFPGGTTYSFGLFHESEQIGFICYANYVAGQFEKFHFNRAVIHPDYVGLGLSRHLINSTAEYMVNKYNVQVYGKFSSFPVFKMLSRDRRWVMNGTGLMTNEKTGFKGKNRIKEKQLTKASRNRVRWYSFKYIPVKNGTNE